IAHPIQSDLQTRVRPVAKRFPRASFFGQARWQSRLVTKSRWVLGKSGVDAGRDRRRAASAAAPDCIDAPAPRSIKDNKEKDPAIYERELAAIHNREKLHR